MATSSELIRWDFSDKTGHVVPSVAVHTSQRLRYKLYRRVIISKGMQERHQMKPKEQDNDNDNDDDDEMPYSAQLPAVTEEL